MTNEQKRALRKIVSGLGLIVLLIGPLTELYPAEVGLLIAIAIWVIGLPALTLFGFGVQEELKEGEDGAKSSKRFPTVLIAIFAVIFGLWALAALTAYLISAGTQGPLRTETRPVSQFDRVELSGGGRLIIKQTGKEGLKIEAPSNLIDKVDTTVRGGKLTLGRKPGWWFWPVWPGQEVVYHLNVDDLSDIAIHGSGNVTAGKLKADRLDVAIDGSGRVKMGLDVDTLDARISGSGTFILSGQARDEKIEISGSGDYDTKNLKARSAEVTINGSGDAIVNSQKDLNVSISGSGKVQYLGSPSIDQEISGSGSIIRYR